MGCFFKARLLLPEKIEKLRRTAAISKHTERDDITLMSTIQKGDDNLKQTDSTKILFTDLNGKIMSLSVNERQIGNIIENGVGFDGSSIAGYAHVENSDRLLFPQRETFHALQFADESVGAFIGDIYNQERDRSRTDPRAVLERVLDEADSEFGFRFTIGPEHEFFLLAGDNDGIPEHSDKAGYFNASPHDKGEVVRNRIVDILESAGIQFEKSHHEVTPSQHEINLEPVDPLGGADRTVLFNYVAQRAAVESGYHVTFMSKPFDGHNRNAFHIHLSVSDEKGDNLFYEKGRPHNISDLARQFIGGILKYGRETSIVMASTYNSYKAYVLEREAPVVRGWGYANRSSMVRIPYSANPAGTRLELRSPDPMGNVYLQVAVLIAMGIQGVREKLDCGEPDVGSTYKKQYKRRVVDHNFLPKSLFEALMEAEKGRFLKKVLGDHMYDNFMTLKYNQWELHRTHVTGLEHRTYL
jgi:glutamine synthetase